MGYGLLDIANQSRREALQGISDADIRGLKQNYAQ